MFWKRITSIAKASAQSSNLHILNYEGLILSSILLLASLKNGLISPHSLPPSISSFITLDISSSLLLKVLQVGILHHYLRILTLTINYLDTFLFDCHHQPNALLPLTESMTLPEGHGTGTWPSVATFLGDQFFHCFLVQCFGVFLFIILTAQSYLSKNQYSI